MRYYFFNWLLYFGCTFCSFYIGRMDTWSVMLRDTLSGTALANTWHSEYVKVAARIHFYECSFSSAVYATSGVGYRCITCPAELLSWNRLSEASLSLPVYVTLAGGAPRKRTGSWRLLSYSIWRILGSRKPWHRSGRVSRNKWVPYGRKVEISRTLSLEGTMLSMLISVVLW